MSARRQRGQAGEAHGHAHVGDRGVRGAEQIHRSPECQIVLSGDEVTKNEPVRRGDQPAAGHHASRRILPVHASRGLHRAATTGRCVSGESMASLPRSARGGTPSRSQEVRLAPHVIGPRTGARRSVGRSHLSDHRTGHARGLGPQPVEHRGWSVIASPLPGVNIPSSSPCTTSVG